MRPSGWAGTLVEQEMGTETATRAKWQPLVGTLQGTVDPLGESSPECEIDGHLRDHPAGPTPRGQPVCVKNLRRGTFWLWCSDHVTTGLLGPGRLHGFKGRGAELWELRPRSLGSTLTKVEGRRCSPSVSVCGRISSSRE